MISELGRQLLDAAAAVLQYAGYSGPCPSVTSDDPWTLVPSFHVLCLWPSIIHKSKRQTLDKIGGANSPPRTLGIVKNMALTISRYNGGTIRCIFSPPKSSESNDRTLHNSGDIDAICVKREDSYLAPKSCIVSSRRYIRKIVMRRFPRLWLIEDS